MIYICDKCHHSAYVDLPMFCPKCGGSMRNPTAAETEWLHRLDEDIDVCRGKPTSVVILPGKPEIQQGEAPMPKPGQKPKQTKKLLFQLPAAILIVLSLLFLPDKLSITIRQEGSVLSVAAADQLPQANVDAEKLYEDGKTREAALAFWKQGDEDRSRELWREAAVHKTVASGGDFAIGLKADGTVIGTGQNYIGQLNVEDWSGIIAVAAGHGHTLGLRADGTVVSVGADNHGQCKVGDWTDIIQIDAGSSGSFGLKADGNVVAVGEDIDGRMNIADWKDIVAIAAAPSHTVGLKADGTVVAVGNNRYGQCEVSEWTDIIEIAASMYHTLGLKADGTVVVVGSPAYNSLEVSNWKNIHAVATSDNLIVGLQEDGSLMCAGNQGGDQEPSNSTPLPDWQNICEISASTNAVDNLRLVGVREDGTAIMHIDHSLVTANVDDWADLMLPKK